MYVPRHFREDDLPVLHTLMKEYSFATLVSTNDEGLPLATPLPFVFDPEPAPYGTLRAHMALGNPQWHTLGREERPVLVIFQGPHSYITPSWYENELSVPTWNYATVHVWGRPRVVDDNAWLRRQIEDLTASREGRRANPGRLATHRRISLSRKCVPLSASRFRSRESKASGR